MLHICREKLDGCKTIAEMIGYEGQGAKAYFEGLSMLIVDIDENYEKDKVFVLIINDIIGNKKEESDQNSCWDMAFEYKNRPLRQ